MSSQLLLDRLIDLFIPDVLILVQSPWVLGLKQTHNNAPIVFKHPVNIVGNDGFCDTLYGFGICRQIWLN